MKTAAITAAFFTLLGNLMFGASLVVLCGLYIIYREQRRRAARA